MKLEERVEETDAGMPNRIFELTLDKYEFDEFAAGCPEFGWIQSPNTNGGTRFYIFPGIDAESDKVFRLMHNPDGYYVYIGCEAPRLPQNARAEDFNKYANIYYNNLRDAINNCGRIPIEETLNIFGNKITKNLGYVILKVEDEVLSKT